LGTFRQAKAIWLVTTRSALSLEGRGLKRVTLISPSPYLARDVRVNIKD